MRDYPQFRAIAHSRHAARRTRFGAWEAAWHHPRAVPAAAPTQSSLFAPGYGPSHAISYLYAAFFTVGLFAFTSYFQPYLLNVNLALPEALQGRTQAAINFANELLALLLVAPIGALADKIGRRPVYACGFLWLAAGFTLYPLARSVPELFACSLFFSVGVAAAGTMLGTVLADTPSEPRRGAFVGVAGFFQGLGAALLVLLLGRLPKRLVEQGIEPLVAGRMTLGVAAALCVLAAVVVFFGLKRGTPSAAAPALPLRRIVAEGLAAARLNQRIWFAWLLQFGSFGDRVVLGTFFSLRLQQSWQDHGLTMAEAMDRARLPMAAALAAGTVSGLIVGVLLDRVDRVRIGTFAMLLAAIAYLACGFLDDPAESIALLTVAVLLGVGQIAAIVAGHTLLGQEAPRDVRGAVYGLAGICASAAILFTNGLGGWMYDVLSKGGPFFLLAGVNFAIFLFGLRLSIRSR